MSERDQKIVENLALVHHILWKKFPYFAQNEDMFQIGAIGLIKAVDAFDEANGTPFGAYAARCIENEILLQLRRDQRQLATVSFETIIGGEDDDLRLEQLLGGNEIDYFDLEPFLRKLSPNEKLYVTLRGDGLTKIQIARTMGVSRQYITSLCQRLREKYRRIYKVKE